MKLLLTAVSAAKGIVKKTLALSLSRQVAISSAYFAQEQPAPAWGSRKVRERKKLIAHNLAMCDPEIEAKLAPFRAAVKEQVCIKMC
jgi:hypothetical protein